MPEEVKLAPWRPRAFATAAELQKKIQEYFNSWKEQDRPVTIVGMASYLGVLKETIKRYENGEHDDFYNDFSSTVKLAREYIENDKWEKGLTGKYKAAVCIFDLKNNHGAVDKFENIITNTLEGKYKVEAGNTPEKAYENYKEALKNL